MINVGKCYEQDAAAFDLYLAEYPALNEDRKKLEFFRNGWLVGRLRLREEQIEKVVTGLSRDIEKVVEGCPRCGEPVDCGGEYGIICSQCYADDMCQGQLALPG